jgi:hyperosmotically inducible protein
MKKGIFCLLAIALLPMFTRAAAQQNDKAPADVAAQAQMQDAIPALPGRQPKTPPANEEERIARKVRHELVMQPYYTIWDWLAFRVNGNSVELLGSVNNPGLKNDAVHAVKRIDGVASVVDHITQLPPSPMDDRIRKQVAHAVFSWGNLSRYSWPSAPGIHIIVNGGRVWLEGVVDSQPDKDAAGLRANGVPDVFQVTNNLRVPIK